MFISFQCMKLIVVKAYNCVGDCFDACVQADSGDTQLTLFSVYSCLLVVTLRSPVTYLQVCLA